MTKKGNLAFFCSFVAAVFNYSSESHDSSAILSLVEFWCLHESKAADLLLDLRLL